MGKIADTNGALAIIGGGGHGKVAIATAEAAGHCISFVFDDDVAKRGFAMLSHCVTAPIPDAAWWLANKMMAHIAIGDNESRKRVAERMNLSFLSLVHPRAYVHESATIGTGTLICAGAVVHPDARIGSHCIINTGAIVEHDCEIGDFAHIGPRSCLAGAVVVGTGTLVGVGSTIIPGIKVGSWALIGAGSVVISPVTDKQRVVGVPARLIGANFHD